MTDLGGAIRDFLTIKRANGRSHDTVKWYKSVLMAFVRSVGNIPVQDVTSAQVTGYVLGLRNKDSRYEGAPQRPAVTGGLSVYSIQSHVRALKAFWRFATEEYQLHRNPARHIETPQLSPPEPNAIKPRDVVRILDACDDDYQGARDRAIVLFLADTGARVGGLCSLTLPNLDLLYRHAIITEKRRERRKVFFTYYTSLALRRWLDVRECDAEAVFTSVRTGAALTTSGVYQVLKRLGARAGVKRYNPHAFRDGFAVAWIQSGGDISTLARLLGHKDVKVTADYYALFSDDELQSVKADVNPLAAMLRRETD